MIAKAKAISHGINDIRYITGESHNKKHTEKIYRVLDNMMPLEPVNPKKPDVPLNKNDAFQKVQKRRVQEKR